MREVERKGFEIIVKLIRLIEEERGGYIIRKIKRKLCWSNRKGNLILIREK